ncbi:MAG: tetratricopeptide repeat protein [Pirellulales bacterium]|nr:tetratricopeptide repeat protein [Pirellulales bacterium]
MLTTIQHPVDKWLRECGGMFPADPEAAWRRVVVARILLEIGEQDAIDADFTTTLEFMRKHALPGSWYLGDAEAVMGKLRSAQGRDEEAEAHLIAGLNILRKSRGDQHWLTREAATALVKFYKKTGREAEAVPYEPLLQVPQLAE